MKQITPLPCMREWVDRHMPAYPPRPTSTVKAQPAPRTPATVEELAAIRAIADVTYPPAIGAKRFARQIQGETELTAGQRDFLWKIVWRYRRQIKDKALVAVAEDKLRSGGLK